MSQQASVAQNAVLPMSLLNDEIEKFKRFGCQTFPLSPETDDELLP